MANVLSNNEMGNSENNKIETGHEITRVFITLNKKKELKVENFHGLPTEFNIKKLEILRDDSISEFYITYGGLDDMDEREVEIEVCENVLLVYNSTPDLFKKS